MEGAIKEFQYTTSLSKLRKLKRRNKLVQGGTSASKTWGILPILIDRALRFKDKEISVVSESMPHLKKGCIKDFKKIMKLTGRWDETCWKVAGNTYHFKTTGSYIEFFGVDNADKLRGARRDICYVNEANNVPWEAWEELDSRTHEEMWADWNPVGSFWAHEYLIDDEDSEFIILNYEDNEACPPAARNKILKAKTKADLGNKYFMNWYNVYGLGLLGTLEDSCIYNAEQLVSVPDDAVLVGHALDEGYNPDPMALVSLYFQGGYDERWIFVERLYETKLGPTQLKDKLEYLGIQKHERMVVDNAGTTLIAYLDSEGYNVEPTKKREINYGLDLLNSIGFPFIGENMKKEVTHYQRGKDKNGNLEPKKFKGPDHLIDAARYIYIAATEDNHNGIQLGSSIRRRKRRR